MHDPDIRTLVTGFNMSIGVMVEQLEKQHGFSRADYARTLRETAENAESAIPDERQLGRLDLLIIRTLADLVDPSEPEGDTHRARLTLIQGGASDKDQED